MSVSSDPPQPMQPQEGRRQRGGPHHQNSSWEGGGSLAGKRVVVTRPQSQAAELCVRLAALGATPIVLPTIDIAPLEDYAALDGAIARLESYDWLIFTSANGVAAFWQRLAQAGRERAAWRGPLRGGTQSRGPQVAAIGPATAEALAERGVLVCIVPDEYVAERILDGLGDVQGLRILLPRADIARKALAVALAERGAVVDEVATYRTVSGAPGEPALAEVRRGVDAITFTSSSSVHHFRALAGVMATDQGVVIACIGPITARTAREEGFLVDVVAEEYTLDGLVRALADYFARRKGNP